MQQQPQPAPHATANANQAVLALHVVRGEGDCEDCGGYRYGHFRATFPDGSVLAARHDGHLGGGIWDGTDDTLYRWCLAKLGYLVHLNGKPVEGRPFREEHMDRGFTEYRAVELFPGEPEVLALTVQSLADADDPEYETPAHVTLPALPGCDPVVFATEEGAARLDVPAGWQAWEQDYGSIFRHLLAQRVTLVPDDVREHDDSDED
jgi:hypothetical protein